MTLFNPNTDPHVEGINDISLEIINNLHGHTYFRVILKYFDLDAYNSLASRDK